MRSGGNNFNYFPENQLTKLGHLVQFKRVLMSCLGHWGRRTGHLGPPCLCHCCCTSNQIFYGVMGSSHQQKLSSQSCFTASKIITARLVTCINWMLLSSIIMTSASLTIR